MAENAKILLVEDDNFIVDIYQKKLGEVGYQVTVANNGQEAIDALKKEKPDVMLLDLVMPYMDGFEVLEAMKKEGMTDEISVILLTNLSQKEDVEKGMESGAKDYLIKSHFTPSEVVEKIKKWVPQV
ncbi:MAG: response regulator [Candidatus Moranbacteria bacterium]|nr:response regulator [Candidatus Moranbacteria bacterium]